MARRRSLHIALAVLSLFLVGTFVVLSAVSFYLRIAPDAYLSSDELARDQARNATPYIPRILHQTWKTDVLPEKWSNISQNCRDIMPDYEYMLWTDASSRQFLVDHYPWFVDTFDGYPYNIQRADAIRYFVLHHFGGIYLDLDVGCIKRLDPLLPYKVVLPKTIPVGVSNDLMFAVKSHPFMEQTIHNLVTFDHSWILNYPTVMFSTGPMFLSAQLGLYAAAHQTDNDVRVLPKSLYGKNAEPGTAPDAFFAHYYGSSWHADDAGFITFLGRWGNLLLYLGSVLLILGIARLLYTRYTKTKSHGNTNYRSRRRLLVGRYDIILPRVSHRNGGFQFDLGSFSLASDTQPPSPTTPTSFSPLSSTPSSPLLENGRMPLPPFGSEPTLPVGATAEPSIQGRGESSATRALRNARAWVRTSLSGENRPPRNRPSSGRRRRSTLFFLPAIFTPSSAAAVRLHDQDDVEMPFVSSRASSSSNPVGPLDKKMRAENFELDLDEDEDGEDITLYPPRRSRPTSFSLSRSESSSTATPILRGMQPPPAPLSLTDDFVASQRPPPYQLGHAAPSQTPQSAWSTAWGEWEGENHPAV